MVTASWTPSSFGLTSHGIAPKAGSSKLKLLSGERGPGLVGSGYGPIAWSSSNRFVVYDRKRSIYVDAGFDFRWLDTTTGATRELPPAAALYGVSDDGTKVLYTPLTERGCCESFRQPLTMLDLTTGQQVALPQLPRLSADYGPYIRFARLAGDGRSVVVRQQDYVDGATVFRTYTWDAATNALTELPKPVTPELGNVAGDTHRSIAISATGVVAYPVQCATNARHTCPMIWNPATGASVEAPDAARARIGRVMEIDLSADGSTVAWLTARRLFVQEARVWRVGDLDAPKVGGSRVRGLGVSNDGRVSFYEADGDVSVWNEGRIRTLVDAAAVGIGAISANGRSVIFVSNEKLVKSDKDPTADLYMVRR